MKFCIRENVELQQLGKNGCS